MSRETEKLLERLEWQRGVTPFVNDGRYVPAAGSWVPWPDAYKQVLQLAEDLAAALREAEERAEANAKDAERWRSELAQLVGSDDPKELEVMARRHMRNLRQEANIEYK